MSSERAAPFAPKPPEGWDEHVEVMRATRMFLLQKKGPTRFVVRGDASDRKFTVLVGSRARCSCGVPLCLHHLFVMLKVLKVPPTNPLAWQTSLIDSEVDSILDGGIFGKTKEMRNGGAHGSGGGERTARDNGITFAGRQHRRDFLRRGGGRTSAGGNSGLREGGSGGDGGGGAEGTGGGGTRRLDIVPGEVCPVCQEEMEEEGEREVGPPIAAAAAAAAAAADGRLTYCRDGCGNNMHARCMLMYAEHRRSSGEKPCCPLCRVDWGLTAVRALREDAQPRGQGSAGGRSRGRKGGGRGGGAATAVAVPVTCRSCGVKVQAAFFRCLVCTPAGSWDLCRRCYTVSGARGGYRGGGSALGPCTLVGRDRHPFVQGEAATDPPEWKSAESPDAGRTVVAGRRGGGGGGAAAGRAGGSAAAGVLSLEGREITTADFELLLTLDASTVPPLHEHLLQALPLCNGAEEDGRDGSFFSSPALGFTPPAGGDRADRSGGGGIVHDGGNDSFSEILPLEASTFPSQSAGRATTVAAVLSSSSPVSTVATPSLGDLVAAAAVVRDAAAAAAAVGAVAEPRGDEAAAEGGGAEPTATNGGAAPTMQTTAVPSLPSDQIAPASGSFPVGSASCCCCSRAGASGDSSQATENISNAPSSRSAAATRHTEQRRSPPSSSSPVASSYSQAAAAPLRRLPCGHSAHEACLIPLILESVGRGDPSRCRCPLDSSPVFPALSRRRRRVPRPRPGSDSGASAAAAASHDHDHRRATRSASSAAAASPNVGGGGGTVSSRHARAAAARELLRRNAAAGFGFGGGFGGGGVNAADALGIALFGSGLAQPAVPPAAPPPPPSTRRHAIATVPPVGSRPRGTGNATSTASARENESTLRRAGLNGSMEGESARDGSGGGSGPRGCGNAGQGAGGGGGGGGAGPRDGSLDDEPSLDGAGLFVGGEGIADAPGGEDSAAGRAGRAEEDVGAAARSRCHQRRRPAGVVRGSTVGGGRAAGRRRGSSSSVTGGRDRSGSEARASGVTAADSVEGLELTTRSFAANGRGGAEENAAGNTRYRGKGGDEMGGRGTVSGRGRDTPAVVVGSPSLAVEPAMAGRVPPAHPSGVDGMILATAGG